MYFEDSHDTKRKSWVYHYTGEVLAKQATSMRTDAVALETRLRNQMADMMRNGAINANGRDVDDLKNKITETAKLAEELSVYVTEFMRDPTREFSLSLGDVVFFGLNQ